MRLLGALGFDWKIFLIQSLNFLILFLLLKELFFRPFIQALKHEQEETAKVTKAEEIIRQEKEAWQKEKEAQLIEAKTRVDKILAEAEEIRDRQKEQFKEEEKQQEQEALEQIKARSQAIIATYKDSLAKDYQEKIKSALLKIFAHSLTPATKINIQESFWLKFMKSLERVNFKNELLKNAHKDNKIFGNLLKQKKKAKTKKINVTLASAYSLPRYQRKAIKQTISKKFANHSVSIELKEKLNPELIAGFLIEVEGVVVEESLREKIQGIFQ